MSIQYLGTIVVACRSASGFVCEKVPGSLRQTPEEMQVGPSCPRRTVINSFCRERVLVGQACSNDPAGCPDAAHCLCTHCVNLPSTVIKHVYEYGSILWRVCIFLVAVKSIFASHEAVVRSLSLKFYDRDDDVDDPISAKRVQMCTVSAKHSVLQAV